MQLCEIPSGDPETPQSVTEDCCWYSYCTTILCRTYIRVYQRVNCSAWPHIQWFRGICRNAGPFRLQDWSPPIRWLIFQDSSGKGKGLGPCSPCGEHLVVPTDGEQKMWQCVHLPVLYGIKSSPERRSVTWTSALTSWGRPLHSSSCSRVLWNWWKSSHPRSKGPQPKNVFELQRRFGGTPVSVFPYTQSLCLLVPMEGHSNWLQVKKMHIHSAIRTWLLFWDLC